MKHPLEGLSDDDLRRRWTELEGLFVFATKRLCDSINDSLREGVLDKGVLDVISADGYYSAVQQMRSFCRGEFERRGLKPQKLETPAEPPGKEWTCVIHKWTRPIGEDTITKRFQAATYEEVLKLLLPLTEAGDQVDVSEAGNRDAGTIRYDRKEKDFGDVCERLL